MNMDAGVVGETRVMPVSEVRRNRQMLRIARKQRALVIRYARRLRGKVGGVLRDFTRTAAERAASGKAPVSRTLRERLAQDLFAAQFGYLSQVVMEGSSLAIMALGGMMRKSVNGNDLNATFRLDDYNRPLATWLRTVASNTTRSYASTLEKMYNDASRNENDVGQIARQIRDLGNSEFTASRARMISFTNANWSMNSGARIEYRKCGVRVFEWLTSEDDAVCPWCKAMNGSRVADDDPFWHAADRPGAVINGDIRGMPPLRFDVPHPPLHPNCGCTLMPVFVQREPSILVSSERQFPFGPLKPAVVGGCTAAFAGALSDAVKSLPLRLREIAQEKGGGVKGVRRVAEDYKNVSRDATGFYRKRDRQIIVSQQRYSAGGWVDVRGDELRETVAHEMGHFLSISARGKVPGSMDREFNLLYRECRNKIHEADIIEKLKGYVPLDNGVLSEVKAREECFAEAIGHILSPPVRPTVFGHYFAPLIEHLRKRYSEFLP